MFCAEARGAHQYEQNIQHVKGILPPHLNRHP